MVVIDVFRAGNTAAALFAAGASEIIATADLDEALRYKREHPDWVLVGERGGLKPEGCDFNNSPDQVSRLDLVQRRVVFTTSAGTQGLTAAAPRAEALFMATLINARRSADHIRSLRPDVVTLVAIGLEARTPAPEDDAVAAYLADRIQGREGDYRATVRAMLRGSGADRLRRLGQWRDLAFCLRLDGLDVTPQAEVRDGRVVLRRARTSGDQAVSESVSGAAPRGAHVR